MSDIIRQVRLKPGLNPKFLPPFNTTPLHGVDGLVHTSLSGLEGLVHDLGYAVMNGFGMTKKQVSDPLSKRNTIVAIPGKLRTVRDAKKIPTPSSSQNSSPITIPGLPSSESTTIVPPSSITTEVIPELDMVSVREESGSDYTYYLLAGVLTLGAIGFGVYHYQKKKKPSLDDLDKEARDLQRQLQGMAKVQPQMDYTRTLNNPLLRKLGVL